MSFTERVPGMRPGSTGRNLIVLALYLAVIWLWPLAAGYYVGRNRGGSAEMLSRLPGISNGGGVLTGIVVAIGGYVLLLTLAVTVPDADTDTTNEGADIESTSGGVDDQPTESTSTDTEDGTTESSATNTEDESDDGPDSGSGTSDGDSGGTDSPSDSTADSTDDTTTDGSDGAADDTTSDSSDSDGDDGTSDTSNSDNTVTVEVVDVIDGDTMDIEYENGTEDTVRLIGVDTPEVHTGVSPDEFEGVPDSEAGRQCLDEYGDEASAFAEQELGGDTVQLQYDELSDRRGSYGRLLVYIIDDGENFNHLLLDEGLARVYDSTFTESERFYDTEAAERENQTGVWSCQNADDGSGDSNTGGDDSASQTSDSALKIVEIHEDAEGEERENLDDEYVTFRNDGDEALDLSGWVVEDDADHDYTVPDGFTLDPGAEVTLYTGQGEDSDSELYWGQENPVWNNAGDTVHVTNADGELIIERSYE